ncbi:GATA zinc finger domain-containing protein 8-like [Cucurbita moschata]|uniref:GATA zinc finger domain-containing protein 8-like n=1 Tax=Cucurbita moschata TaxID=3662 RepID=A0A6J1GBN8_CUCMO|nr:GATA zinc finger domain-containing protein 8-like [Cucurbita moschata]
MADNLKSLQSSITDDNNKNNNNLVGNNGNNGVAPPKNTTKKKNKSLNILRVALMLLRRRSSKPNAASVEVASKGMWNRLVASIRPLHVQSNHSPQHPQPIIVPSMPDATTLRASPSIDCFEDVKSSSASSVDGMSRYASAINLQELDQNNDDDDDNNDNDNQAEPKIDEDENADDMIDAKAEMFIAQFYEQMRRSNSDVRYLEMIKRSIR